MQLRLHVSASNIPFVNKRTGANERFFEARMMSDSRFAKRRRHFTPEFLENLLTPVFRRRRRDAEYAPRGISLIHR